MCRDGQVTCDNSSCVGTCHWSAWSSWSPCDVTCGLGLQQRYRWVCLTQRMCESVSVCSSLFFFIVNTNIIHSKVLLILGCVHLLHKSCFFTVVAFAVCCRLPTCVVSLSLFTLLNHFLLLTCLDWIWISRPDAFLTSAGLQWTQQEQSEFSPVQETPRRPAAAPAPASLVHSLTPQTHNSNTNAVMLCALIFVFPR